MPRRAFRLAQMLRNERRKPESLEAEQSRLLRALVRHASERVPFYRELYAAEGIDVMRFRGLEDLVLLPVIDKAVILAGGTDAESIDAPRNGIFIRTSGSSGPVFAFRIDQDFDKWRKAQYLRPYLTNGRRLTDRVLRLTAAPYSPPPWFSRFGLLRESRLDCDTGPAEVVDRWRDLGPDVLQGYPSSLLSLAKYCMDSNVRLSPAPRLVFSDSELLLPEVRRRLEAAFGTKVIDVFGTYETDNIAYQCERGGGYHIALDSVVLEVMREGKPVQAGETGELVVTVLRNRTTPLLRYNLHDRAALDPEPCSCGRTFPLLRILEGRSHDQLRDAAGRERSPMGLLVPLSLLDEELSEYRVEQMAVDRLKVTIVLGARSDADTPLFVQKLVSEKVPWAKVEVSVVPNIPRDPSGKLAHFRSRLESG